MKIILSALILLSIVLSSCNEDTMTDRGTIRYLNLEGGFYGIVADNGKHFDPVNLAAEFQQDGLKVEFEYKISENQMSIHMWGTLIEIISIRKIE